MISFDIKVFQKIKIITIFESYFNYAKFNYFQQ